MLRRIVGPGLLSGCRLPWVCLSVFAFCLLPASPQVVSTGPPTGKVSPVDLDALPDRAEKEGWNLILVPDYEYFWRLRWRPDVTKWTESMCKMLAQYVRQSGGITWVGGRSGGLLPGGCLGFPPRALEDRYMRAPVAARDELEAALIGSFDDAQMDSLLHRPRPEEVLSAWAWVRSASEEPEAGRPSRLNIGGCVTGDQMTDLQRRLCGLIVSWDRLFTRVEWEPESEGDSLAMGDLSLWDPGGDSPEEWAPSIVITSARHPKLTPDMRESRPGRYDGGLWSTFPPQTYQGKQLEELLAWAKENAGPEPEPVQLPEPVCSHTTNGPTRDVTSLLTQEEARLSIPVPSDVALTQRAVAAGFRPAGFTVQGGSRWYKFAPPPGPNEEEGKVTLLELLNSILWETAKNGYFVREGKTFRLVYDWELSGRYCVDPTPYLPAEALEKPITVVAKRVTIAALLKTLREQSGLPLYPGYEAEASDAKVSAVVKHVTPREILPLLGDYLYGAWEKMADATLQLIPRAYIETPRFGLPRLPPEQLEEEYKRGAGMSAGLLLELLGEGRKQRAGNEGLLLADLTGPARHLLLSATCLVFSVEEPDPEQVKVADLRDNQDGTFTMLIWLGKASKEVTTIPVPTIPPNRPVGTLASVPSFEPEREVIDVEE